MKNLQQFGKWIKSAKGVATSLIEATATVAVGAVLAGVAVGGAIDAINDSKIQAAIGDVSLIGQGVITFYEDNAFFPLFKDGNKTGGSDTFFDDLVSENGTYPGLNSAVAQGSEWGLPTDSEAATSWDTAGFFGHKPNYTSHDSIEGHLIRNELGGAEASGDGLHQYPLRGNYIGDPTRGWAGPYISALPKTDPWGNKYIINIRELHAKHLLSGAHSGEQAPGSLPKIAVIVISAGPNRTIETGPEQQFDAFSVSGDDIVFRIK